MSKGRRPGLVSSAAHLVVQYWIDDATEQLSNMMYTCSLDVVRDYPEGLSESSVALLLGVTEQAINQESRAALMKVRAGLHEHSATHAESGSAVPNATRRLREGRCPTGAGALS